MMANPFDQFDEEKQTGNPFDQFDAPQQPAPEMGLVDKLSAFGRLAGNAATMGLGKEIAARAIGMLPNEDYASVRQKMDARDEAAREQLGATPEVLGSIAGGVALTPASWIAKTPSAIGQVMRTAATSAPLGFVQGATSAPAGEQLEGGLKGATASALLSGLFTAGIKGTAAIGSKLSSGIGDSATRFIGSKTGELQNVQASQAEKKIMARMAADLTPDELQSTILKYQTSKDKSLIEYGGERLKNLAEGASQYPSGAAASSEFFKTKIADVPEKIKQTLSKTISSNVNYYDTLDDVIASGRAEAKPLYDMAYKSNQSVASPLIDKILRTPEGSKALNIAAKNLQNEMTLLGRPDPELTAAAKEAYRLGLGESVPKGGVAAGLKLKTLDEIKRAMDSTINMAYRAGDNAEAARIINLKNALKSEMIAADKTGAYKAALSKSGDYLSNKEAMDKGLSFLNDDPELLARNYNQMGGAEKRAYKTGVLKAIRTAIDNKSDGQNVARIFDKTSVRQKLGVILKRPEMERLFYETKAADDLYKLRNQLIGNSRTAQRQIAAEEFNQSGMDLISDLATRGVKNTAISSVINMTKKAFDGLSDDSAKQVADMLYETDPIKKFQIAKRLYNIAQSTTGLRQTDAANSLAVFYKISDALSNISKNSPSIATGLTSSMESK